MTASADAFLPRSEGEPELQYNRIFEILVRDDQDDILPGLVAYALYKRSKREWAEELWRKQQRKPTPTELAAYVATWTPTRLQSLQSEAETILLQHGSAFIDSARPEIREEAIRDEVRGIRAELTTGFAKTQNWSSFGWTVLGGFLAALMYTVFLIIAAAIIKRSGIDLISLLR